MLLDALFVLRVQSHLLSIFRKTKKMPNFLAKIAVKVKNGLWSQVQVCDVTKCKCWDKIRPKNRLCRSSKADILMPDWPRVGYRTWDFDPQNGVTILSSSVSRSTDTLKIYTLINNN